MVDLVFFFFLTPRNGSSATYRTPHGSGAEMFLKSEEFVFSPRITLSIKQGFIQAKLDK